jgi:enoyl-CoA hydratase/carnithine racemase
MIRTTSDGDVCEIRLDRPERRNALTRAGLTALETAVEDATAPVIYLSGAGPAFCAGADLDVVRSLDAEEADEFAALGQRVARTLATYDGAVVAGIDGAARGGGVELALACDLRVATPDATFAETGVKLGLFGAWGGTARLPEIVGQGEALDLALSGRTVDAETALRTGLVSRVTDDPREVADELANVDHAALKRVKTLVRDDAPMATTEQREREAFADLVGDADL